MAPPNRSRPASGLSRNATAPGPSATFAVRIRKVFLVRVAAIRRRASRRETETRALHGESATGPAKLSIARAGGRERPFRQIKTKGGRVYAGTGAVGSIIARGMIC